MFRGLRNTIRLVRAARVLARYDALFPLELMSELPPWANLLRSIARLRLPFSERLETAHTGAPGERLSAALEELGPSYIKLGQFMATRADIIGDALAEDLSLLRDKLPPFPTEEARGLIEEELGAPVDELFAGFSEPVAAASIAQVHRATVRDAEGVERAVAVKVLRPGVERRMKEDLDSFFWAARLLERAEPAARRLRPVDVVRTLAESVAIEMDLRLEAAAISEMAENTALDEGFSVPAVDWARTAQRVLTLEWVNGIPATDRQAILAAGHDLPKLARTVIRSFLLHAMRDGFFHADMHQGNLFVLGDGTLMAVDFGIVGRLRASERRFLAETLYGFLKRDYRYVAELHFKAGYVPPDQSVELFAQALRAVGEPIQGQNADRISMGRLLQQLFQTTAQFKMQTQPQLLLLQKTMVVVEGVARELDPAHNIWDSAEPVLQAWITQHMGLEGRLNETLDEISAFAGALRQAPALVEESSRILSAARRMIEEGGLKLHPETLRLLEGKDRRGNRAQQAALWTGALALLILALAALF